jgi:hypothetical protein
MSGNGGESPERLGDDAHAKVTRAPRGAGVSRMQVALILDDELERRELPHQPIAQALRPICHGGAVSDSTRRSLLFSQSTCGIMNTTMAALMPKTLNFTHTSSSKLRAT